MKNVKSIYIYLSTRTVVLALLLALVHMSSAGALLTTQNGISSSLINDIFQSSDGTIWISTEDGLNKYDGAKFQIYRNVEGDSTSLCESYALLTFETSDGELLIGTRHGISLYDKQKDCFKHVTMYINHGMYTANPYINAIVELKNGTIYIATSGHGLFELNRTTLKAMQLDVNVGYYVSTIFKDSNDNVWISSSDRGISRILNNGFVYTVRTTATDIQKFCEDRKGNIFAGSIISGLYIYNNTSDVLEPVKIDNLQHLHIKSITEHDGKILIGTDGTGAFTLDYDEQKVERLSIASMPFDSNKIKVHTIMADRYGNIWLGLFQKGVVVVPTLSNDFKYIGYKSANQNIIGSNYIASIYFGTDSMLYIGTDNDGLYAIDCKTKKSSHATTGDFPKTIMSIAQDEKGKLWLGTYLEGIYSYDPKSQHYQHIDKVVGRTENINSINAIVTDMKGHVWIGTMGGGLYLYTPATNEMRTYPTRAGAEYGEGLNILHNKWISCLLYSKKHNRLYIGSLDGLGCLNTETQNFTTSFGRNRIMAFTHVKAIAEDKNGDVWIAANVGLYKLIVETNELKQIELTNGLMSNMIKSVECDKEGNIWASTNNGIIRIDAETHVCTSYYEQDGIVTSEFSSASCKSRDGEFLYFGGTDGVTFFRPADIISTQQRPSIRVSDFYINGQRLLPGTKSGDMEVVTFDSDSTETYNLCHTDNNFAIEFTTKQLLPQRGISYIYTLTNSSGESDPTAETGNGNNRITFRNMSPGKYTLEVIARTNGMQSETKRISLIIHPAIYATTFAKILYVIVFVLLCYFIQRQHKIRVKTRAELATTLHKQQMHAAKMDMFTNIAHEIRTPMSLVIGPLKELMTIDDMPQHKSYYDVILRNTQRILRLMAQILDIQKIDAGKMQLRFCPTNVNATINDVCSTFDFEARAKNIRLKYDCDTSKENIVYVDPQHFDHIVTNLVSNAIKYSPNDSEVIVTSTTDENNYTLTVEDSGPGFSDEDIKHIFERFHRLSNSEVGFGIGLDLTNTIVKLHHGTITAGNRAGNKGGVMTVVIPTGIEHLKDEDVDQTAPATPAPADNSEEGEEEEKKPKTNLRIVLVDDDPEIRNYIKSHLSENYKIVACSDGKEALEEILTNVPDLVVTDVVMPNMDGFTLCRKIKQNVNINFLPVIILTSRSADTDRIESYENGADAYIAKPFSIDELSATIKNIISQRQKFMANIIAQQQVTEGVDGILTADMISFNKQLMQKVTAAINAHISQTTWSIEDLATEVGMSRVHLHRKMREITNMTTRDYVRNVRLRYAATLLATQHYDIQQVADMTGFSATTYFAKTFKAHYGVTPKEYLAGIMGDKPVEDEFLKSLELPEIPVPPMNGGQDNSHKSGKEVRPE